MECVECEYHELLSVFVPQSTSRSNSNIQTRIHRDFYAYIQPPWLSIGATRATMKTPGWTGASSFSGRDFGRFRIRSISHAYASVSLAVRDAIEASARAQRGGGGARSAVMEPASASTSCAGGPRDHHQHRPVVCSGGAQPVGCYQPPQYPQYPRQSSLTVADRGYQQGSGHDLEATIRRAARTGSRIALGVGARHRARARAMRILGTIPTDEPATTTATITAATSSGTRRRSRARRLPRIR